MTAPSRKLFINRLPYLNRKKITAKDSTSLEERIRLLTCDIDEPGDSDGNNSLNVNEMERRDSPAGEETPHPTKFDKSFSPSSSASSSSTCSNGSTYKKITDLFNKEKRQEKILETDENPIVIIPQDCRCPAGPDIGMGVQIQGGHTQIHQPPPPPRQTETKRHILSTTLAPLTACVAGQRDDFSYYMLAKPGDRTSTASSQTTDQYSIGDIDAALQDADIKKVAPDVIAGTPGQETDELANFAQQEAIRLERIKKRYSSESAPASGVNSDDDEQNDYGFNKRPSVRGIKPRFGSTNEILQQMQDQLSQPTPTVRFIVMDENPFGAVNSKFLFLGSDKSDGKCDAVKHASKDERFWCFADRAAKTAAATAGTSSAHGIVELLPRAGEEGRRQLRQLLSFACSRSP